MSNTDILSIQLYSLRNYGDLERSLDLVSSVGFKLVEPVMAHYDAADRTRAALDARGLKAPSGHFSLDAVSARTGWVADVARTIGIEQIIVPAVPPAARSGDAAAWQRTADALSGAAPRLADAGLTLAYHNHDWDFRVLDDGRTPMEILLTAPGVHWQADVAWIARAGADIADWCDRYGDRLVSCHVKDMAPAGEHLDEDGWTDVGAGTMDWAQLWRRCRATPAKWMVLEHDNPKHPEDFVARSFAFLSTLNA